MAGSCQSRLSFGQAKIEVSIKRVDTFEFDLLSSTGQPVTVG